MYELEGIVGFQELRYTPSGQAVLHFNVAQSNDWYNRDTKEWINRDPTWFRFTIWGDQAEKVGRWITKGMRVLVYFRRVTLENWEANGKSGTSLIGNNVVRVLALMNTGKTNGAGEAENQENQESQENSEAEESLDEIS
jgi:single stranded DNA-binding protein